MKLTPQQKRRAKRAALDDIKWILDACLEANLAGGLCRASSGVHSGEPAVYREAMRLLRVAMRAVSREGR